MHDSRYPTFTLGFRYALPLSGAGSSFSSAAFGLKQVIDLENHSMFRYSFEIGSFLSTRKVLFPDYRHLDTQPQEVQTGTFFDSYELLKFYKYSSSNEFAELKLQYRSQLLILKRLPLISDRIWSENVYFKYACNPYLNHYMELGYGLGNIIGITNLGVFVGYENFRYRSAGLKLSLGLDMIR